MMPFSTVGSKGVFDWLTGNLNIHMGDMACAHHAHDQILNLKPSPRSYS